MTFSHITDSVLKRLHYGAIDPVRDWIVLIILSSITLTGIIVWNIWTFDTVANGRVIGSAATSSPPVFDNASLDAIHGIFANRAAEKEKYDTGTYRFADPSQ